MTRRAWPEVARSVAPAARTATLLLALAALIGCDAAAGPRPSSTRAPSETSPASATTVPQTAAPSGQPDSSAPPETPKESPGFGEAPAGPTEAATVVRVVDGDTIVIDRGYGEERVRYIGVDTPETVRPGSPVEWMGPEASAANKRLVEGRRVVLERDVSETDSFGRLLRYVWLVDATRPTGWLFVNLELVAGGFAQVSTYPPDVRYVELYLEAQTRAREAGLGLWGAGPEPTLAGHSTGEPGPGGGCDPAYPTVCIPPPPPDLDCGDVPYRRFTVLAPDPHRFDGDHDGIGCES